MTRRPEIVLAPGVSLTAPASPGAEFEHERLEGRYVVVRCVLEARGWYVWIRRARKPRERRVAPAVPVSLAEFEERYTAVPA